MDDREHAAVPACRWVRTKGGTAPAPPEPECRNGHEYRPGEHLVGWRGCHCAGLPHRGHMTWRCGTCDDVRECGEPRPATHDPPGDADGGDQP